MIGARFGHVFDKPLAGLARRIPLSPTALTIIGFGVSVAGGIVLAGDLLFGGLLVLAGAAFDVLDGVVARTRGKVTRFGAYLDSVLDRFSDACMMAGMSVYFLRVNDSDAAAVSIAGLVASFGVSYARARAEGLGVKCEQGIMERPERIVLVAGGAIAGFPKAAVYIMVFLTAATVVQRILFVRRKLADAPK